MRGTPFTASMRRNKGIGKKSMPKVSQRNADDRRRRSGALRRESPPVKQRIDSLPRWHTNDGTSHITCFSRRHIRAWALLC